MKSAAPSVVTGFVTAIMTSIVTPTPAAAEIVTVCGARSAGVEAMTPPVFASPLQRLGAQQEPEIASLLALWRDENGFDILLHWGETDQTSLRQQGAEIIGASPTLDFVHLMVGREGNLEHFLFSLNEEGSGELLRSGTDGQTGDSAAVSPNAVCIRPR